jgi:hypothetical protein
LIRIAVFTAAAWIVTTAIAAPAVAATSLTAAQIVEKNVAARGGLEAWRKIDTMVWIGHLETGNPAAPVVPFVLQMKRPDKRRFEIHLKEETSARIFNGTDGWKLRPKRGATPDLVPYTPEELKAARDGPGIDGPLFDYQAKHVTVELEAAEELQGRKTYRLSITLPSGTSQHVWIDAQSFLDVQYDRESRNVVGQSGTVMVHQRNFKAVGGLQIPHTIQTDSASGKGSEQMVIDQVLLNPPLGDKVFAKPNVPMRAPAGPTRAFPPPPNRGAQPPLSAPPSPPAPSGPASSPNPDPK